MASASSRQTAVAESIEWQGCGVMLRRVEGPEAREVFLSARPLASGDAAEQAEAIYRAVLHVLGDEGMAFGSVVSETLFLRDGPKQAPRIRAARAAALAGASEASGSPIRPPTLLIGQPPVDPGAQLEVSIQAFQPKARSLGAETIVSATHDASAGYPQAVGHLFTLGEPGTAGEETRFILGGLCGPGENAYDQTRAVFEAANEMLGQAGMTFRDVTRTWIHLREMERDYDSLNRARREFFAEQAVEPVPASTGIGGAPLSEAHDLCLGLYAVKGGGGSMPARTVMTSPTLNEAGSYGADFVRGMRQEEANKTALHVSGTASIDEAGRIAHVGDLPGQVDRMVLNIKTLLEGQGAGFKDIVSGVTYLKDPAGADCVREKFRSLGLDRFPNVFVEAEVCRPDWLCETEVLAVIAR